MRKWFMAGQISLGNMVKMKGIKMDRLYKNQVLVPEEDAL